MSTESKNQTSKSKSKKQKKHESSKSKNTMLDRLPTLKTVVILRKKIQDRQNKAIRDAQIEDAKKVLNFLVQMVRNKMFKVNYPQKKVWPVCLFLIP